MLLFLQILCIVSVSVLLISYQIYRYALRSTKQDAERRKQTAQTSLIIMAISMAVCVVAIILLRKLS